MTRLRQKVWPRFEELHPLEALRIDGEIIRAEMMADLRAINDQFMAECAARVAAASLNLTQEIAR